MTFKTASCSFKGGSQFTEDDGKTWTTNDNCDECLVDEPELAKECRSKVVSSNGGVTLIQVAELREQIKNKSQQTLTTFNVDMSGWTEKQKRDFLSTGTNLGGWGGMYGQKRKPTSDF